MHDDDPLTDEEQQILDKVMNDPDPLRAALEENVETVAELPGVSGAILLAVSTDAQGIVRACEVYVSKLSRRDVGRVLSMATEQMLRNSRPEDTMPNRAERRRKLRLMK